MTNLSNEAFAVLAFCEETPKPFGITVDKIQDGKYKVVLLICKKNRLGGRFFVYGPKSDIYCNEVWNLFASLLLCVIKI